MHRRRLAGPARVLCALAVLPAPLGADAAGPAFLERRPVTEATEPAPVRGELVPGGAPQRAPHVALAPDPALAPSTLVARTPRPAGGAPPMTRPDGTTLEAQQRDDGSQDAAPWLVGSGVAAVLAVGLGGWALKRRMDRTS